jgi:hypothetical protein
VFKNTEDPTKPKPGEGMMDQVDVNRRTIEAQCIPFFSLLEALGNPRWIFSFESGTLQLFNV